ncbi:hypothetical protein DA075_18520 [Methylobacterium currus]|uniref:Transposase IS66 central domain-containing protein n=1 Tax=Methylobacterium currus TaxID=2051553 RepID=A0A2R4WM74_9HYPH|nr:hypothetical protein DA075_18520 [Methylobacterium currus]
MHGKPPDARTRERQTRSKPLAEALKAFAETSLAQVPSQSDLAKALRYMLARWPALMRAFDDGRLALDNNAAERALHCAAWRSGARTTCSRDPSRAPRTCCARPRGWTRSLSTCSTRCTASPSRPSRAATAPARTSAIPPSTRRTRSP